jgi:hypothetical protein
VVKEILGSFLRNVGSPKVYTAPHPRRRHSSRKFFTTARTLPMGHQICLIWCCDISPQDSVHENLTVPTDCFCFCNLCSNIDSVSETTSQYYKEAGDHNDAISFEVKWVMLRNKKLRMKYHMRTVQTNVATHEMKRSALSVGYLLTRIKRNRQFITVATKRELTVWIVNTASLVNGTNYS